MRIGRIKIIIASIFLLGVTACSPEIKKIEQPQTSEKVQLTKAQSVGQTFTARYDGLDGIEININPKVVNDGKVTLHLKKDPQDDSDLATSEIPISRFSRPANYKLKFEPQQHSLNQDYYISFVMEGDSVLSLGIAAGDAYHNGALYINDEPLDAQLRFNLIHDRKLVFYGILIEVLGWIKYLAIGIFLFIIPGWALLTLLYDQWHDRYWYEKIGLAAGLSLAIYPILLLWTHIIGLNLGAIYAWVPPILGIGIICWKNYRKLPNLKINFSSIKQIKPTDVLLLAIMVMVIAVRFWAIRNLPAPMWGDGFQHTVISQLLVDNNGLFNSWQPYADISSFTYHFGFHSLVAVFHWISGISLPQATLWTGQILNVLAVLCLVPLVMKINKNPWGGILCITLAGLVSPMPMYYLNWGRYTQLAGQIILIACVYFAWECFEKKDNQWQIILINSLVMGGLALTHYRVLVFAICFYIAYAILHLRSSLKSIVIKTMIIGVSSFILFTPWFIHVFKGRIPTIQAAILSTSVSQLSHSSILVDPIGDISFYLPISLWILSALIFGWGLYKNNRIIILICIWWILILFSANPQWLKLPGAGVITNFAVFISSYIPTTVLLGGSLGQLLDMFIHKVLIKYSKNEIQIHSIYNLIFTSIFLLICVIYIKFPLELINPNIFALISKPDLKAMDWIKNNISEDSIFVVNSFLAYNETTAVGSDGGWWLPYFSSRKTILPPINYGTEKHINPNFIEIINQLTSTIQKYGITSDKAWGLLTTNHITHIYIGQKHGKVNNSGPIIDPNDLINNTRFSNIYHIDRVWIFELKK